jgi:hypothetical protein
MPLWKPVTSCFQNINKIPTVLVVNQEKGHRVSTVPSFVNMQQVAHLRHLA